MKKCPQFLGMLITKYNKFKVLRLLRPQTELLLSELEGLPFIYKDKVYYLLFFLLTATLFSYFAQKSVIIKR